MGFGEDSPDVHDLSMDIAASRPSIERVQEFRMNFFDTAST